LTLLGIDIGTSFVKGAVLDAYKRRFGHVRKVPFPEPISGLDPPFCEYEPGKVVDTVRKMIFDLAEIAEDCQGIVFCSQMASMVLTDGDSQARSNCIGWRDQRTLMPHISGRGRYFDIYKERIDKEQRRTLGNETPSGMPGCFLFWMAEQGRLESGLTPLSLGDFVVASLCNSTAGVDPTNAMAYGLLNLKTMDWHWEVIQQLGLDALVWPSLVAQGSVAGLIELNGSKVPCYTPIGDYQCSLAGALLGKRDLSINISTGSQVSRITAAFEPGDYQSRPFFDGRFTNTLSHLPAGRSLNVLVSFLTELARLSGDTVTEPWKWIDAEVQSVQQSDLTVDLGFYPGPCGDQGGIFNIRETNLTVGTVFRAAFDNMAANYLATASRIWPDHSWQEIVLSGGLANRLPSLYLILEERFGSSLRLCRCPEEALCGLLLMAMTVTGNCKTMSDAMNQVSSEVGDIYDTRME
jgi:sugar (pentulose or hexulose) kinase